MREWIVAIEFRDCNSNREIVITAENAAQARKNAEKFLLPDEYVWEVRLA